MEVLRYGYRIPFICDPPLSRAPISLPSYHPSSIKGVALRDCSQALVAKSAVELAPLPSLGFYSRLFVVWKTSGSWRPVIDLSTLNLFVDVAHFHMETIQSVLLSVRQGDWMASIDLKEAYLQIPVHPDSRRFLRFVALGRVYQFSALCFGLSTAPQVFSRVMAPVSAILHSWGIRMRRYLDDWLVQSSSRDARSQSLQGARDCSQPFQVSPSSISGGPIPLCRDRLPVFQGFSVFGARQQAVLNSRRISVLRRSSRQYLAAASRHPLISRPSSSWRPSEGPISTTVSPPAVGSGGLVCADPVVSALPQGSSVVARPSSSLSGCLSPRSPQIWTFGPTPRTWVGVLTSALSPLQAFGTRCRLRCPSTRASSWLSGRASTIFCPLSKGWLSRFFATTALRCPICARRGAPGLRF